jgi:nitronate monooxygenase
MPAPAEESLTGTFVLVQQIRDRVRVPVIAAGGIGGAGIPSAALVDTGSFEVDGADTGVHGATGPRAGQPGGAGSGRERGSVVAVPVPNPLCVRSAAGGDRARAVGDLLLWGGQITPVLKYRRAEELMVALVEEADAYYKNLKNA